MDENDNKISDQEILDDERISRYLQGKMIADETTTFLDDLKNNTDLRNQAIAQARLVKGMRQVDAELKDLFRQADENTIRKIASKATITSSNKNRFSTRWIAIAASVAIIVFIGIRSYDYYDTINLGKEYANAFPVSTIIRGETNVDVELELSTLFNNVAERKDLKKTISRLTSLWELSKQDTYNDYTDYSPYIGWNLAIAYLEKNNKAKAKEVLNEMNQSYPEGTAMGDKIRQIFDACK